MAVLERVMRLGDEDELLMPSRAKGHRNEGILQCPFARRIRFNGVLDMPEPLALSRYFRVAF